MGRFSKVAAREQKEKLTIMLEPNALRRTALILVLVGLLWNLVEAAVSLWAGVQDDSVAILAFGLDSIVEFLAGGVLMWRLRIERDELEEKAVEIRARRLLGLSFFLLATYVVLHSGANLAGWLPEPQSSPAGIGIVAASVVVMGSLYVGKMRIATKMQSRSLRAEAMEGLFCDLQDLTILVGLGLNSLFSWWWADPVSALFLVPFLVKEGMENLWDDGYEHGDNESRICFCRSCIFGVGTCRAACCQA